VGWEFVKTVEDSSRNHANFCAQIIGMMNNINLQTNDTIFTMIFFAQVEGCFDNSGGSTLPKIRTFFVLSAKCSKNRTFFYRIFPNLLPGLVDCSFENNPGDFLAETPNSIR